MARLALQARILASGFLGLTARIKLPMGFENAAIMVQLLGDCCEDRTVQEYLIQ